MNHNAMWRRICEIGTEEQQRHATEIRNRIAAGWQTEAAEHADMARLIDLLETVEAGRSKTITVKEADLDVLQEVRNEIYRSLKGIKQREALTRILEAGGLA